MTVEFLSLLTLVFALVQATSLVDEIYIGDVSTFDVGVEIGMYWMENKY